MPIKECNVEPPKGIEMVAYIALAIVMFLWILTWDRPASLR